MAFPSLQNLAHSFKQVVKRFPFELLFVLSGTIAAITYVEIGDIKYTAGSWCVRILLTANIGLLSSLSATLFAESADIKGSKLYFLKTVVAILTASLVFMLDPLLQNADFIRFFLLSIAAHFMVSFAAFTKTGWIQGFWQFNKTIFLRFLASMLYSTVLYLGLAAAIGAMNFLFNFKFESDTFLILWICIAGLFNTIFFLAGVPQELQLLDQDHSYPKGLKIFTQYVLIPLASVYVVILLAYEIKIALEWNLPKGLVSKLILGYAVFGILSLLLVFPIREKEENKWIKTYARSFYFLMLPLLILLFLAVGARITSYGITESRYYLILLAVWLLFITIYFLLSKRQNIKLVPISLSILALLSIYGPQSAFSISSYSQSQVLISIFKKNGAFKDGKLVRIKKIQKNEGMRTVQIMRYLVEKYDFKSLQPYMKEDLSQIEDSLKKQLTNAKNRGMESYELQNKKIEWLQRNLGLSMFSTYGMLNENEPFSTESSYLLKSNGNDLIATSGYDYLLESENYKDSTQNYTDGKIKVLKTFNSKGLLSLRINTDTVTFDLKKFLVNLMQDSSKMEAYRNSIRKGEDHNYDLPQAMLTLTKDTKNFSITYQINSTRVYTHDHKKFTEVNYINGMILIKVK